MVESDPKTRNENPERRKQKPSNTSTKNVKYEHEEPKTQKWRAGETYRKNLKHQNENF